MAFYTTFFSVWVLTPIPIEICYGLLSDAFDETNSFGVTLLVFSLFCGLLHDVFQYVSAHPHPHWNLLWIPQPRLFFCDTRLTILVYLFFGIFTTLRSSTRRFSGCECSPHPHWNFVMDCSATRLMKLTLLVSLFWCLHCSVASTRRFSGCECSPPSPLKFVMECSATVVFLWHETNYFGVSLLVSSQLCGLLHDVFQYVSVHPIPIEILLWITQRCEGY